MLLVSYLIIGNLILICFLGVFKVFEEKVEDEDKGGFWIIVMIKLILEFFYV